MNCSTNHPSTVFRVIRLRLGRRGRQAQGLKVRPCSTKFEIIGQILRHCSTKFEILDSFSETLIVNLLQRSEPTEGAYSLCPGGVPEPPNWWNQPSLGEGYVRGRGAPGGVAALLH
jgi:hypothetical protein